MPASTVHHADVPQKFMTLLSKAASLFLLIACYVIFQCFFDLDFLCSCTAGLHSTDVLFILVPPLILTWIVILTESFHQKSISHYCDNRFNNLCSFILKFIFKYLCLGAVWVSTVLLDGDWYFCLKTNLNNGSETGLPCKESLTYDETLIKAKYKNESLDIAFGVIFGAFVLWNLFECFKFCIRKTMSRGCSKYSWDLLCPPYYRSVYEDLLSEAVNSHLAEELKKLAEERAKQICEEHLTAIRIHEMPEQNQDGSTSSHDAIVSNETVDIFDTWQKISVSYFYLMDENERRRNQD